MEFNLETFFFDTPLYTKIQITNENYSEFEGLIYSQDSRDIDGYNSFRKVQTTFRITRRLSYGINDFPNNGGFAEVIIECKRFGDKLRFYCVYDASTRIFMKVGQYPSVADIHIHEIKQYSKLLPREKLKEFTRAIGLAANGVGIGSFVYLRRIFEFLINDSYQEGLKNGIVSEGDYNRARMDEKIELLKSELPPFLVEHKELYSILSLGVHELDENTCLENFDTLRVGIEIILDEKLEEMRKRQKIEQAKARIKNLKGTIKK
jgi:hypothetical protein